MPQRAPLSQRRADGRMKAFMHPLTIENLHKSAMVFAPHEDDETLGCGGTILLKRRLGADVKVVLMTNGSMPQNVSLPKEDLAALRRSEALAAGRCLGLDESAFAFLDFDDGELARSFAQAVEETACLLSTHRPEEVYLPYRYDPHEDHIAANRIVHAALKRSGLAPTVYEYPVWYWFHWPRLRLFQRDRWSQKTLLKTTLSASFGLGVLKAFRYGVDVRAVTDQKRAALNEYHSQMERIAPWQNWFLLPELSQGEFLNCFFQGTEIFYRAPGYGV